MATSQTGAQIRIDLSGVDRITKRLDELAGFNRHDLLDVIGSTVESQTRRRISDDKTDPEGKEWQSWSKRYAKTRHSGHSLLENKGHLVDSITYNVRGDEVEIGSNLVYAGVHQYGFEELNIPARQYIGLSADDEQEIQAVIEDWFREIMK